MTCSQHKPYTKNTHNSFTVCKNFDASNLRLHKLDVFPSPCSLTISEFGLGMQSMSLKDNIMRKPITHFSNASYGFYQEDRGPFGTKNITLTGLESSTSVILSCTNESKFHH